MPCDTILTHGVNLGMVLSETFIYVSDTRGNARHKNVGFLLGMHAPSATTGWKRVESNHVDESTRPEYGEMRGAELQDKSHDTGVRKL